MQQSNSAPHKTKSQCLDSEHLGMSEVLPKMDAWVFCLHSVLASLCFCLNYW